MITKNMRLSNTIAEIETSDAYENHWELFTTGVEILKKYFDTEDEISEEDSDVLVEIFTIMEESQ